MIREAGFVLLGAFVGGFASGLAGFGTGLVALGIWLHVVDPRAAASLVVICSVVSQVQTIPTIWHAIVPARIWPLVLGGLVGVPVGTMLLARVDPDLFRLGVGMLLVIFSGVMLLGPRTRPVLWGGRVADAAVGFGGGILGGLAGLSGPLPTMWATLRAWGKDERRGAFQTFNLAILLAALLSHALAGMLSARLGVLVLFALPGTLGGAWLGAEMYRRLSDHRFNLVVLGLLGVSGVALIWTSVLGTR